MNGSTGTLKTHLGFLLSRVVVPIWVLAGAMFKLVERTPTNLPEQIWRNAHEMKIDLYLLLAALIFIEFVAVAVMIFSRRWARPAAIAMLSVFCLVLLNEMRTGNFESCGCLGKIPMKPWQMLAIDATLLLGVLFLRPLPAPMMKSPRWVPIGAVVAIIAAFGASFGLILPERAPIADGEVINDSATNNGGNNQPDQPSPPQPPAIVNANPKPASLPNYFIADDIAYWVGKPWRETPLFQMMRQWPKNLDEGTRYVVFYSRTCDHCELMFQEDLTGEIGAFVTAVEIPAGRDQLTAPNAWTMPQTDSELLSLPLGPLWMITPPLAMRIKDGVIVCATEHDHKTCFELP